MMTNERIMKACHEVSKRLPVDRFAVYRAFVDPERKQMKLKTVDYILFKISHGFTV